ncbi:MAG: DUF5677 domain-containing protein [Dehalococcoidia bacterium]
MSTPGFEEYLKLVLPEVDKSLKQQQEQFKPVLEPLYKVALYQSYLFDSWEGPQPTEPRALLIIGSLASQLAMGIHEALSTGAGYAAGVQYRTVFELFLSAKLICEKDTQERSDLYIDFGKVLQWDHLKRTMDAGLPVTAPMDLEKVKQEYETLKNNYESRLTHWWSSVLWDSPKDFSSRRSIGTKGVCEYLDTAGITTSIYGKDAKFTELEVRWFSILSLLTHPTILSEHAFVREDNGHFAIGWKLSPDITRIAPLAAASCGEIIADCAAGLSHPKAYEARTFLKYLKDEAVKAQVKLDRGLKI